MSKIFTSDDLNNFVSDDVDMARAELVVAAVNSWIETLTSRCWGEEKQVTEQHTYKQRVWLRHMDIVSVDELSFGWPGQQQTVVPSTNYYWMPNGRLTMYSASAGLDNPTSPLLDGYLAVRYTYGTDAVPDDLRLAALGVAAGFYNWAEDSGKDIVATSVGSYSEQYAGARGGAMKPTPENSTIASYFGIIKSYKVRHI